MLTFVLINIRLHTDKASGQIPPDLINSISRENIGSLGVVFMEKCFFQTLQNVLKQSLQNFGFLDPLCVKAIQSILRAQILWDS